MYVEIATAMLKINAGGRSEHGDVLTLLITAVGTL
jgi:hypothetical protein